MKFARMYDVVDSVVFTCIRKDVLQKRRGAHSDCIMCCNLKCMGMNSEISYDTEWFETLLAPCQSYMFVLNKA